MKLIFIFFLGILFGCTSVDSSRVNFIVDRYGLKNNSYRIKKQIPILKKEYKLIKIGGDFCSWSSTIDKLPKLDELTVFVCDSLIYREISTFLSPKNEMIQCYFYYKDFCNEMIVDSAKYYINKKKISKIEFDSLLFSWNINPYNE
jgi:hypothetical protein